jgi:uncharacterized membrane protein
MNRYLTVGLAVVGGAAVIEAALVPGILIGGAALLAPRLLPAIGRRLRPVTRALSGGALSGGALSGGALGGRALSLPRNQTGVPALREPGRSVTIPGGLRIGQALAKTITFRIVVTSLDFTSNYIVLGDAATAAGLSGFAFVAGPVFYFVHETMWNWYAGQAPTIEVPPLPAAQSEGRRGFRMSRPLAKTITYRTIATVVDFTTIWVIVGDVATAAGLAAFGFVVGPFVYYGHEKAWDYFSGGARVTV